MSRCVQATARRDRTEHGGLATVLKADIPACRRQDTESKTLENIVYESLLTKWLIYAIFRAPSMSNNIFSTNINISLDKGSKFTNIHKHCG